MKRLEALLIALVIIAVFAAAVSTLHTYMEEERWAWYDAGYDDALGDLGITYINGDRVIISPEESWTATSRNSR